MNNEINETHYIIRTDNRSSREALIRFLEEDGYKSNEDDITNRQYVLDSIFPIVVDTQNIIYDVLHTTTSASGAVSSHSVICEDEFYVLFKGSYATYDEYIAVVKRLFLEYDYTIDETEEFFNRPEIHNVLRSNYEEFIRGIAGCEPRATASCLDLMYD